MGAGREKKFLGAQKIRKADGAAGFQGRAGRGKVVKEKKFWRLVCSKKVLRGTHFWSDGRRKKIARNPDELPDGGREIAKEGGRNTSPEKVNSVYGQRDN